MTSTTTNTKRSFQDMSRDELIQALERRDATIAELKKKKAKKAAVLSSQTNADPARVAIKAEKLRKMAAQQIKRQMKWKPSCKYGTARWSWTALCDEPTFRAFRGLGEGQKTKGGKIPTDDFEELLGTDLCTSIRYGYLYLKGENVNITYKKADGGELKITGGYGMP